MNQGIAVQNAGLVLLNSYFPMLFERLELIQNGEFIDDSSQSDAVQYLQYVAAGMSAAEANLPLNKILCGMTVTNLITTDITVTQDHIGLVEGLLNAAIGNWSAIGESSIIGFRGNWLIRDGMLIDHQYHYELVVEKRAYDPLINQASFSFLIIKFPWMEKPIHVTWPY